MGFLMRLAWVVGLGLLAVGCAGRLFYLPDPDGLAAWSQSGGGPAALGFCAAAPAPPLQLRWQQKLSAAPLGGALVDGGLLLQVTAGPTLLAFDCSNGRVLRRRGKANAAWLREKLRKPGNYTRHRPLHARLDVWGNESYTVS
jgi:hypothetical protein